MPKTCEFMRFPSRRSVVFGTHYMVASSQQLACQAGLEILKQGGNAADAAVAVAAALNVTEPASTGIGGDCFCLYYDATTKRVNALNGSGRSPKNLTLSHVRKSISDQKAYHIPFTNINAVTVPGAAAGWVDTIEWFGSGRVSLADALRPAIELAEHGFGVAEISAKMWQENEHLLRTCSAHGVDMLLDGRAPRTGEIMRMPKLARTFRELAERGKDGFYKGRIAEAIVELIQSKGGVMTLEDLAEHTSTRVEPISIDYKGVRVWECPPNGQGLTALMALGILSELQSKGKIPPLTEMRHNSGEYLHAIIESLRLAFADTRYYVSDPEVVHVPVEELLSEHYLAKRAEVFDPEKASYIEKGSPSIGSDTVYFSVVDDYGNACSFIISNYYGFGSAAVPKDCGFSLQCRGSGFVLQEGHPNCVAPSKRPYHTIIPSLVTKHDELWVCFGVMGGDMQPQGHVQVFLNLLEFGFSPQIALDAPRIRLAPGNDEADEQSYCVCVEESIDEEAVSKLRELGHRVKVITGWERAMFGRGQVVQLIKNRKGDRLWAAGSDFRGDGCALGW